MKRQENTDDRRQGMEKTEQNRNIKNMNSNNPIQFPSDCFSMASVVWTTKSKSPLKKNIAAAIRLEQRTYNSTEHQLRPGRTRLIQAIQLMQALPGYQWLASLAEWGQDN